MVQKRRKPPKKRNSTEEREPSDGSKAPNHADTAKSIGGSPRTEWMKRWKYEDLSGFRQAKKDCMSLVNKDMGVK